MDKRKLSKAIDQLGKDFPNLNWNFRPDPTCGKNELISQWLGDPNEEVMICVFKGKEIHERFHRQDFFFFNFAYREDYQALSAQYNRQITVKEGDCYIGQPYSGYALRGKSDNDIIIPGILIRKKTFFNEYLAPLSSDPEMLRFFLEPQINKYSDEYIHLTLKKDDPIWDLLQMMIIEYADKKEDTQKILKPMIFSLMMFVARAYQEQNSDKREMTVPEQMTAWMESHLDSVTLESLADHFGYHPNYVSSLLHRETGSTFTKLLLDMRMQRAVMLMKNTDLSLEKIADMVGYHTTSNFYKAFHSCYGVSPRSWMEQNHQ